MYLSIHLHYTFNWEKCILSDLPTFPCGHVYVLLTKCVEGPPHTSMHGEGASKLKPSILDMTEAILLRSTGRRNAASGSGSGGLRVLRSTLWCFAAYRSTASGGSGGRNNTRPPDKTLQTEDQSLRSGGSTIPSGLLHTPSGG
jgi:hypothetical protein